MASVADELLSKFVDRAESRLAATDDVFEAISDLRVAFGRLATSAFLTEFVIQQLELARRAPSTPLESVLDRSILVAKTDHLSLHFSILPIVTRGDVATALTISSLTANHLLSCVAGGPVILETYRRPTSVNPDVFDGEHQLSRGPEIVISAGEPAAFRAGTDFFRVVESGGAALFRLETRHQHRLRWDYDARTLRPLRVVAGLLEDSRLDFATRILAHLGDRTSADQLARLTRTHPAHFVRWSALQALGALDSDLAVDRLRAAVDDSHPHVSEAARATLVANGLGAVNLG